MARITVEEAKDFKVLPPESLLHLKVMEVNIREVNGQRGPWEKIEFKFKILGVQAIGGGGNPSEYEDLLGEHIYGSTSFRLTDNPENRLRQWCEAILRMELGVGFELDTDMLLNREVRAVTSQYEKRNTDSQGRPIKRHQVESLLPLGTMPQPQGQPQQQQGFAYGQPMQQNTWGGAQPQAQRQDPWATPGVSQPPPGDPWGQSQARPGQEWDAPPF